MKRLLAGLFVLLSPSAFAQSTSAPELNFDSVPNFIKLPPDMHLGEASGVAVNSKGNIYVYSRGGTVANAFGATASQILEFDRDGGFIREVGKNLYAWAFAHTVRIDKEDNIWATDKGSDMIVKMSPAGRVMMVFGRKSEASDSEAHPHERPNPPLPAVDGRFRQPTDVAWDRAGNTYISDGYINSRVAKVDRNGTWLKSWGSKGAKPGEFNTPHSIAADAKGNIYVADRGNRRVQVFDGEGTFLREFTIDVPYDAKARPAIGNLPDLAKIEAGGGPKTQMPGAPWALCITPGSKQVLYAPPTLSRVACSSYRWTERCWACWANPASN
jgi:DNA-binding beta-propeller fold protein YncE